MSVYGFSSSEFDAFFDWCEEVGLDYSDPASAEVYNDTQNGIAMDYFAELQYDYESGN